MSIPILWYFTLLSHFHVFYFAIYVLLNCHACFLKFRKVPNNFHLSLFTFLLCQFPHFPLPFYSHLHFVFTINACKSNFAMYEEIKSAFVILPLLFPLINRSHDYLAFSYFSLPIFLFPRQSKKRERERKKLSVSITPFLVSFTFWSDVLFPALFLAASFSHLIS